LPEPILVAEHVERTYAAAAGAVPALHALDATVPAGAVTAVVGVSGSGKSTLLRLLAGHDLATGGSVRFRGRDLATLSGASLRRYRRDAVVYISQRPADNFFPHLTLADHGASSEALQRLGLAGRGGARASQLSGGELARAAFALALSRPAALVLSDEPTAELDDETASLVLDAIRAGADAGRAFVVATHDPAVLAVADHVIELAARRPASERVRPDPAPGGPPVLRAHDLVKSFGSRRVVDRVSLELRAGELATVVGRSGSGKSTLLMLLAAWLAPDSGRCDVLRRWPDLAYVPQRFGLVPELTVADNIALPARLGGGGEDGSVVAALGLDGLAGRLPAETSVGQQQRVAVARALAARPRILVVDEPTSHQDAASAELVWDALARAAAAGTSVLVATHEPDAAARAARAWELDDGRLTPSDALA
jgi:ABC-type lipoprotein export system ATPase subunit